MNNQEFNQFLQQVLSKIKEVLSSKEEVYSANQDRFHNFKKAAQLADKQITEIEALRGMQLKHQTAISDYVNSSDPTKVSLSEWWEKIIDDINYNILLLGIIQDKFDSGTSTTAMAALNQLEKSSETDNKPETNEPIQ